MKVSCEKIIMDMKPYMQLLIFIVNLMELRATMTLGLWADLWDLQIRLIEMVLLGRHGSLRE